MKATKKIVGAACALVAAVALSAGSTYAWFAMNQEAAATGMQITATTPANLAIVEGYKTNVTEVTKTSIVMSSGNLTNMKPVAVTTETPTGGTVTQGSLAGVSATGGKLYAVEPATYTADGAPNAGSSGTPATYKEVDNGTVDTQFKWATKNIDGTDKFAASLTDYVVGYNMTLANTGVVVDVTAEVQVTWTSNQDNTYKFLRTGFLVGVGETYKFHSIANDSTGTALTATGDKFTYTNLISNFAANSVVTITFFAWFDGTDSECITNNALNPAALGIGVNYKATTKAD